MAKQQSVTLFVTYVNRNDLDENDRPRVSEFVESTMVGKDTPYENPSDFINQFQKLYRDANNQSKYQAFTITNIVIG